MKKILLTVIVMFALLTAGAQTWSLQYTNFPGLSTGVDQICIVDSNVVWVKGFNGSGSGPEIRQFSMTIDGGTSWSYGEIALPASTMPANIAAVSMDRAYCIAYDTLNQIASFWYTSDGGATWDTVYGVMNNGPTTFANVVKFWDASRGFCMGDPVAGKFDVYYTNNGGLSWTAVAAAGIPNPLSGEYGYNGADCAAIGDNGLGMFLTNKGRVYVTTDYGMTWSITSANPFTSVPASGKIFLGNAGIILAANYLQNIQAWEWKRSADGGATWSVLSNTTASFYQYGISYIPGTGNNFVSTSPFSGQPMGVSHSEDGGLSWTDFLDPLLQPSGSNIQCLGVAFHSLNLGWVGIYDQGGTGASVILKYENNNVLINPGNPDTAYAGDAYTFTFTASAGTPPYSFSPGTGAVLPPGLTLDSTGLLHGTPTTTGIYNFIIEVTDAAATTASSSFTLVVMGGSSIGENNAKAPRLYPNPCSNMLKLESEIIPDEIIISDIRGCVMGVIHPSTHVTTIPVDTYPSGLYFLRTKTSAGVANTRFIISR